MREFCPVSQTYRVWQPPHASSEPTEPCKCSNQIFATRPILFCNTLRLACCKTKPAQTAHVGSWGCAIDQEKRLSTMINVEAQPPRLCSRRALHLLDQFPIAQPRPIWGANSTLCGASFAGTSQTQAFVVSPAVWHWQAPLQNAERPAPGIEMYVGDRAHPA